MATMSTEYLQRIVNLERRNYDAIHNLPFLYCYF